MSRFRQANGDDHPDAAAKHLDDADALIAAGRHDGGAYLSGYVVECSLKSIALVDGAPAMWGHDLNALSADALRLVALPGARSAKYQPQVTAGHSMYAPNTGWRETIRYRHAGAIAPTDANDWLNEARRVFQSVIVPMRLDGVL